MDFSKSKRIVVKVGTNVLTKPNDTLDKPVFRRIVEQLAILIARGWKPILVSSGAVGAGQSIIGKAISITDEVVRRQVLSSIGQASLMKQYFELFQEHDLVCAQVLATKEDFAEGEHYRNMTNCFEGLLSESIVPIVNENDVVSLTELMFTDNDELAGLTANMVKADTLIILSNIDGLYTGAPDDPSSQLIPTISSSDVKAATYIATKKSSQGRGGMKSKFETAQKAASQGIKTFIANGKRENVILNVLDNKGKRTEFRIE